MVGLGAVDGSSTHGVKPYKPVVEVPLGAARAGRPRIVLTGGPGGGKSALIDDLSRDPAWGGRFVAWPETAQVASLTTISSRKKLFQRVVVNLQMALEDALDQALGPDDPRAIICHRGSLDPLAFWLQRGWSEEEFFQFTGTTRASHYQRYTAVIHLVTAAEGVARAHTRWPHAQRPEEAEEAIQLDLWLREAWGDHPCYRFIDNAGRDWTAKSQAAREALAELVGE